jgi:hypothetical protein
MIAYNRKSLDNLAIQEEAAVALRENLISQVEMDNIAKLYPVNLYSPNFFIRIGLFLLTAVIILMLFGLFCLMLLSSSEEGFGILTLFVSLLTYGALEMVIREKNHYRSGIDDAMIWLSMAFLVATVNLLSDSVSFLGQSVLLFILSTYYLLRFGNLIIGGLAFIAFLGIVFYGLLPLGNAAKVLMPFLLMAISFGVYWLMKKYKNKERLRHYKACGTFIEILALVVTYVAGNYFVVREVSNSMFDLRLKEGESIPGGWIFWILTVLIPAVYVARGIQKRDVILLRTGLLLVAAIVFTVRYYYHFMPLEIAMTIGGVIMIGVTYGFTKYLTPAKHGFTHAEPNDPALDGLLQVESLVVVETFGDTAPEGEKQFDFGGGSGGGAGASGQY